MSLFRIALANIAFPPTREESVAAAIQAVSLAGAEHAGLVCFPECFVPGYRRPWKALPPPIRRS